MTTATSRLRSLGRAETTLLLRNRTALFTALALPVLMVVALAEPMKQQADHYPGVPTGALLVTGLLGLIPMFVVYYNLTAAYVARRGELVLKRLRTGEARDLEILAGTAVPSVVLALLLSVVLCGAGAAVLDLSMPVNPLLVLAGLVLSIVLLVALAALSSVVTRTVESAGLTTLPVLLLSQFGSGLLIPLDTMPDQLAAVFRALPTTPAQQLIRLGWFGTDGTAPATDFVGSWSDALPLLALALAWTAAAGWATNRWFRWEPRR
ncbi:ABC transporter permease [Kitasatospora sp. NPDC101801]|uniref:ABC transporter permease n=1 Tax=Kitasatospora sp. NPDC101801 TaxID=3364103 RepID=UPI0037FE5AAD